jgi:hypothetical protein
VTTAGDTGLTEIRAAIDNHTDPICACVHALWADRKCILIEWMVVEAPAT